jgi:hypothetical protein
MYKKKERKSAAMQNARVHDAHKPRKESHQSSSHPQVPPPLTHNPPPHLPTAATMMKCITNNKIIPLQATRFFNARSEAARPINGHQTTSRVAAGEQGFVRLIILSKKKVILAITYKDCWFLSPHVRMKCRYSETRCMKLDIRVAGGGMSRGVVRVGLSVGERWLEFERP